jgi:predicted chitinase
MRITEILLEGKKEEFIRALKDFVPLAKKTLELDSLPKIKFLRSVEDPTQPTFGKYVNHKKTIYLAVENRHIIDVLRTLAHELVHYKQDLEGRLGPKSGKTGSPEENEAHAIAGIVMRRFDKKFRHYFHDQPLDGLEEGKNWNEFKRKLKHTGQVATGMAVGIGALKGYDYLNNKPEPAPQAQSQPAPAVDYDEFNQYDYEVPPDETVPEIEADKERIVQQAAKVKKLKVPHSDSKPAAKKGKISRAEQQKLAYVNAQKMLKLPDPYENYVKEIAIAEGIVGEELDQFLGQLAHESANFTAFEERADSTGKNYFIKKYWKDKEKRTKLGNVQLSDAWRYRGRGLIHLTGRDNYQRAGKALGFDLVGNPHLASKPDIAIKIAIWYWKNRVSNKVSPEEMSNTGKVTHCINPGANKTNVEKRNSRVSWFRRFFGSGGAG